MQSAISRFAIIMNVCRYAITVNVIVDFLTSFDIMILAL